MANISEVFNIDFTLDSKDGRKQKEFEKIINEIKNSKQDYYNIIDKHNCANGRWAYENNLEGYASLSWKNRGMSKLFELLDIGDEIIVEYDETECGNQFAGHGYATLTKDECKFSLSHEYDEVNWDWKSIYESMGTTPEYAAGFFLNVYGKRERNNDEYIDEFLEYDGDTMTHYRYEGGHCDIKNITELDEIVYYKKEFAGCEGDFHEY